MKNKKNIKFDGYLKDAKKILRFAKREYEIAKETKNNIRARDAVEKGYLCLLKIVNVLFLKSGMKKENLPRVERGRLYFLTKYADRDTRAKYHAIRHSLHIDAFHDGIINFKDLDERFEDLENLVRKIGR